jgi:transcriptional regulator with XRE-family HTH domain
MLNVRIKDAGQLFHYAVPMTTTETMGDRIKVLRQARNLTQEQLADRVGVTKSAVSQWEGGNVANIKLQTFFRLLEILQTDYQYLVFGPDRNQSQKVRKQ